MFAESAGTRSAHTGDNAAKAVGSGAVHAESESEEKVKLDGKMLYYVRVLETKSLRETIPAISSIVNQINAQFRCKAVFRIHGDKASELTGEHVEQYFEPRGVTVTHTAGFDPNSNGRAEGGMDVIKTRARTMLQQLGRPGRCLWPLALQHARWCLRAGTTHSRMRVPAFGDPITAKIKEVPADAFAPRGKEVFFLGAMGNVTNGVLTGSFDGVHWRIECSSNFVLHDPITYQEEFTEETAKEHEIADDTTRSAPSD